MATIDEIFATMPEETDVVTDAVFVIDPNTRAIIVPGTEAIFGVESDAIAERKYFKCPRVVGNGVDLSTAVVRVNFRNANGEADSYVVTDVKVVGDDVGFSWELSRKVTMYMGQIHFIVCVVDGNAEWNTTLATGVVLEGLEPEVTGVEEATNDVVAQLVSMVTAQTTAVQNEGAAQVTAVQDAAAAATAASKAEIEAKGVNTLESIPEDYTALSATVDALTRISAPGIVCTAEGSAVSVSDASDNCFQGLRIFGRSTQDGTPTPEAPVEIVSVEAPTVTVCGKNLLKNTATTQTLKGVTFNVNEDGSFTAKGTSTGDVYFGVNYDVKGLVPGELYYLSGCPNGGGADTYRLYAQTIDGTTFSGDIGSGVRFTAKTGQWQVLFAVYRNVTVDLTVYPMLRLASVENANFESHNSRSLAVSTPDSLPGIPVTSGGNYTDSDGQQWICDEVDLERGVYVQRVGTVMLTGGESWSLNSQGTEAGVNVYHFIKNGDLMLHSRGYCTHFNNGGAWSEGVSSTTNTFWVANDSVVAFKTDGTQSLTDFKNWIRAAHDSENPVTMYYVSKTPIETPLSETEIAAYRALHTNNPYTTVLNDSGAHMAVTYTADTKLYIDNKIAALVGG